MSKGKYIITHGLPASGKSTWAEEEIQRLRDSGQNAVRVNRDDIRSTLFGEDYHNSNPVPEKEKQVNYVQKNLTDEFLSKGYTVINDDTNLNLQFMGEHLKTARKHGTELQQEHFDVSVEECKRRNKARGEAGGREVPDRIIDKMAKKTYGKDGRMKRFYLGENTSFAYDQSGNENEDRLEAFKKEQSEKYPENSRLIVAFDLDGTLVDVRKIADQYMSDPKNRKYHQFHMASASSEANPSVLKDALQARENGYTVYAITARSDNYARVSMNWLKEHDVPVSRLYMRKDGDFRKDYDVKTDIINEIREEGNEIVLAYEDNPTARAAYNDAGIRVVEVPYYKSTPLQSSAGSDEANSDEDENLVSTEASDKEYPEIKIESAFGSGKCIRCGSALKDTTKTIGDRCKQLRGR